jgi:hypothetical protein
MKKIILISSLFFLYSLKNQAQNLLSQTVQTEFGFGISIPSLNAGTELLRAKSIRDNGMSYYQNENGERKKIGTSAKLTGWSLTMAYYRRIKKIKGLMLGSVVRVSLTVSESSVGGYEEGYFFNFLSVGVGAKYYPFTKNNFFIKGDLGMASVLTKNRFLNELNEQRFFHQFGIGLNTSTAIGYSFTPFKNKEKSLDFQIIYQNNNVRVEVDKIGDDQWKYSALNVMLSMNF